MNEFFNELCNIVDASVNGGYICAKEVYAFLSKQKDGHASLLKFFFEKYEGHGTSIDETVDDYENAVASLKMLRRERGKMVDELLNTLIKRKLTEQSFYQCLWDDVINNGILEDDEERSFALYYVWIDSQIPYFLLPGEISMTNEEYGDIIEKIESPLKKLRFAIFSRGYEQRTQRAGAICDLLEGLENKTEKVVFLSRMIAEYENIIKRILKESDITSE